MSNLKHLRDPFPASDVEWRIQQAGAKKNGEPWAICVPYLRARAIMDRLDDVLGPENWEDQYVAGPAGGVLCGLSIHIETRWVTKWDGAENTDVEGVKGGISNSLKRTAVKWGIGRYLYKVGTSFAKIAPNGEHYQAAKQGKYEAFRWNAPTLPDWALPQKNVSPPTPPPGVSEKATSAISAFERYRITRKELEKFIGDEILGPPVNAVHWTETELGLLRTCLEDVLKHPEAQREKRAREIICG